MALTKVRRGIIPKLSRLPAHRVSNRGRALRLRRPISLRTELALPILKSKPCEMKE